MKPKRSAFYQSVMVSPRWAALRAAVIMRDGAQCKQCGARFGLEVQAASIEG